MHTSGRDPGPAGPSLPDEADGAGSLGAVVTPLAPPPALEERVVAALVRRGLLAGAGVARYALLLYGGLPRETATEMGGVEAHRRWARELARRGHYVSGEKLGAEAREVSGGVGRTGGGVAESALSGFFIVSARSAAEAEAIARTIPHLRDGGRVVLRPVDPT